jgi:hypothetical protein
MGGWKLSETNAIHISAFSGVYCKMPFHGMFQIGVSFYLLYTQVGLAFLAGAVFTIILIPVNKYIASKIGKTFCALCGTLLTDRTSIVSNFSQSLYVS